VSIHCDHYGSQYIENEERHANVNILPLTVAYLDVTINIEPKMQNRKLELTDLAKSSDTCGSTGTGQGLARQQTVG